MRKYVDVDELKENICKRVNNPVIRGWLNRLINETPAADVVEIKHGRETARGILEKINLLMDRMGLTKAKAE